MGALHIMHRSAMNAIIMAAIIDDAETTGWIMLDGAAGCGWMLDVRFGRAAAAGVNKNHHYRFLLLFFPRPQPLLCCGSESMRYTYVHT